jgi:calcineurin-like phosphoesterase family protein
VAFPRTPDGCQIYAVGDLHGRFDLLRRIQDRIAEDAAKSGGVAKTIIYLGDYVDRGPQSFEIIDALTNETLPGFDRIFLKGNHEDMLLRFLDNGDCAETWLANGGVETLASYGIEADRFLWTVDAVEDLRRQFSAIMPVVHMRFFRSLDLYRVFGDYIFVHAGLRPETGLADQKERDFMWIRHDFLKCESAFPGIVVHGHSISPQPEFKTNRIGIDTGAYRSGKLTCLVLTGEGRRVLQT